MSAAPRIETFYLGPDLTNATADQVQAALRNNANWPIVTSFISPKFPTTYLAHNIEAPCGALLYESGKAFSRTAAVPYLDDPAYLTDSGTYVHHFSRSGAFRFDDWWSLGISARYDLPLAGDFRTFVKVSVANVTNSHALVEFQTSGRSGRDSAGNVLPWQPVGNCKPGDEPSKNCTGFGRITSEDDYQKPREFLVTVAFDF